MRFSILAAAIGVVGYVHVAPSKDDEKGMEERTINPTGPAFEISLIREIGRGTHLIARAFGHTQCAW